MNRIEELLARGVVISAPESVEVDPALDPQRIAPGVVIHAGCRLFGARTSIGPDCELGREGPATVDNCRLGAGVKLKGGSFCDAVFLDGAVMGSGSHVRAGTLLEEQAEMAHTVGLKQSIFFPFVVGGSLINFCDALMAGGRSRKDHSEIGSSFIHFNFTPNGDKATASLVGDVPRGVMLNQPPVFLGGQGGLTGPRQVAYGTVLAAGSILRKDVTEPNQLVVAATPKAGHRPFAAGYRSVASLFEKGAAYIGNLAALQAWYDRVRRMLLEATPHGAACLEGALELLAGARKERMKRLQAVVDKVEVQDRSGFDRSLRTAHAALCRDWPAMRGKLELCGDLECPEREVFLAAWQGASETDYVARVQGLPPEAKAAGTAWLQRIVDAAVQVVEPRAG